MKDAELVAARAVPSVFLSPIVAHFSSSKQLGLLTFSNELRLFYRWLRGNYSLSFLIMSAFSFTSVFLGAIMDSYAILEAPKT